MLRNNNFEFNENHYLQTLGTAIGTKMAPSYANLFMDRLERRLLSQAQVKPYIWLRYIDDVLMVWTGSELEMVEYLNYINEAHETIKFTWDWYATPKVTKYQRCNFIIQIHKFPIKIDTISINLLFECVKIVEFNINVLYAVNVVSFSQLFIFHTRYCRSLYLTKKSDVFLTTRPFT